MRRTALLLLCTIGPGGTLAACLSSSSTPTNHGNGADADVDATFPSDAYGVVNVEAAADGGIDAPVDSPAPTGVFTTTPVDFGLTNCGSAPPSSKTYTFTNSGPVPVTYSASVGTGTIFSIVGASSGTVAPGDTGSITIAAGVVPTTSTAGQALTGTLTLTTDVPGYTLISVPLTITPQGGSITLSPATAAFPSTELSVKASAIPLTITNSGNAPVTVTLGAPTNSEFSVTYTGTPAAATLAAGASLPGASAGFTPSATGAQTATSAIQTTGVMCASPATSIAFTGTGAGESVTAGPTPLDFGTVSCGAQSSQVLPVTITNGYGFAINYTTKLAAGNTIYTLDVPSGSVPANGTATVKVTPKAIPSTASVTAGAFNDTLTINTTAPGNPSSTIALQESAQGAILGMTMATKAVTVVAGQTGTLPFTVTNTGNVAAPITLLPSGAGFGAAFTGTSTASSGTPAPGNATFTPAAAGTVDGSLSISTSAVTCGPLPAAVSLTGTGVGPVASYATTTLPLTVTCGGSVSSPTSLSITNTSPSYPLTVTASSQSGLFDVVAPATITVGSTPGTISIESPAVATGAKAAGTYSDVLLLQTNEFGNPTHQVPVTITVDGANLTLTTPTIDVTQCETSYTISIENTGSQAATVTQPADADTFSLGNFQPSNTTSVSVAGGNGTATNSILDQGECHTGTDTFVFTATGPVCQGATLDLTVNWNLSECNSCC